MPTAAPDTTLDRPDTDRVPELNTDNGDHDRFSHYTPKAAILASAVEGTPCVAICGKVWVPSRDPQKFPVCPDCQRIYDEMKD